MYSISFILRPGTYDDEFQRTAPVATVRRPASWVAPETGFVERTPGQAGD